MAPKLTQRLAHAWNAFAIKDDRPPPIPTTGYIYDGGSPNRRNLSGYNAKRVILPILTQIALDVAGVEYRHSRVDDEGRYLENMSSRFNECLLVDPNLDQGPAQIRKDMALTCMVDGVAAVVPVDTTINPGITGGYDITQLRVGTIRKWMPEHVTVSVYDQRVGARKDITLHKGMVAIVENPFYEIMNEPNSLLQRLLRKLNQLDVADDRVAAGKLDILLQLPYTIKHETRRKEADLRLKSLEDQLQGSKYGIGYIDGTERVTQLNRPAENNLLAQAESLEKRVYSQLGLVEEIFFGTADEATILNYYNRTVFPLARAFQEEFRRKFLTRTARGHGQDVLYFKDPFDLVPVNQLAEIADKFTRNEIMAPNEFRPIVGLKPVSDPDANKLRNRNMPDPDLAAKEENKLRNRNMPDPDLAAKEAVLPKSVQETEEGKREA